MTGQLPCFEDDDDRSYRDWVNAHEVTEAERQMAPSIDAGHVEVVRVRGDGKPVYRLTASGRRRAEELLGLIAGSLDDENTR